MKPLDFDVVQNIRPGRHLYQFYHDSSDCLQVMTAYFRAGLAQGHACLWLVAAHIGCAKAYETLKKNIVDLDVYIAKGAMVIHAAEDWYLTAGRFDQDKAVRNAGAELARIKALGYDVFRGGGDVGAIPAQDWPQVHQYECMMGPWISQNSVIGLCAYPIAQCTLAMTKGIVECHDDVLVGAF